MLPSDFPEVQDHPTLKRLLQNFVDPYVLDLRTLLGLPEHVAGNCAFTAAGALLNLIAGTSVCLFDADAEALHGRGDRGRRFRELLQQYYPWQEEGIVPSQGSDLLYESARNPMAHSLGLDTPPTAGAGKQMAVTKPRLTDEHVLELEDSATRPAWLPATVEIARPAYGADEVVVSVPALYRGIHQMLRRLLADAKQAADADALAVLFRPLWDKVVHETVSFRDEFAVVSRRCECGTELVSPDGGQNWRCPRC